MKSENTVEVAMRTIKSLQLKNFTTWETLNVEFDQVTCIKGNNGQGKSNILLALEIILFNDDFPDTLIKRGQKDAWIKVEFSDGSSILRERNKKGQTITLTDIAGKSTTYNSTKCTEQVQEFTGFKPIKLDANATAERLQVIPPKYPHFLMSKSPDVTMRYLSALIGGQGIETVKTTLVKELNDNKGKIANEEANLAVSVSNQALLTGSLMDTNIQRAYEWLNKARALDELQILLEQVKDIQVKSSKALTDMELEGINDGFCALDAAGEKVAELEDMVFGVTTLKKHRSQIHELNKFKHTLSTELRTINAELNELLEEFKQFKCKKCNRIVAEVCV